MPCQVSLSKFPYFSQLKNTIDPYGSCALTSAAMCLNYLGVIGDGGRFGLPDQLRMIANGKNWVKNEIATIGEIIKLKGCKSYFRDNATISQIRNHILSKNPVILHGYFTAAGHVIAVNGFSEDSLCVSDPYGEYWDTGYDTEANGSYLIYSNQLINEKCRDEIGIWAHFVSR